MRTFFFWSFCFGMICTTSVFAITLSDSVTINATVGEIVPTIESTVSSGGGQGNTSPSSFTSVVMFHGTTSPGGSVRVSQVGGPSVVVVANRQGIFQGSIMVYTAGSTELVFIPILDDGTFGMPQTFQLSLSPGYIIDIDHLVLQGGTLANANPSPDRITLTEGDCTNDDIIDEKDFVILRYWYGQHHAPSCADLNGDGIVTLHDFSLLAYRWHDL